MILLRELMEVIAYALDVEVVDVDSSMESLEEWDSLGHLYGKYSQIKSRKDPLNYSAST